MQVKSRKCSTYDEGAVRCSQSPFKQSVVSSSPPLVLSWVSLKCSIHADFSLICWRTDTEVEECVECPEGCSLLSATAWWARRAKACARPPVEMVSPRVGHLVSVHSYGRTKKNEYSFNKGFIICLVTQDIYYNGSRAYSEDITQIGTKFQFDFRILITDIVHRELSDKNSKN